MAAFQKKNRQQIIINQSGPRIEDHHGPSRCASGSTTTPIGSGLEGHPLHRPRGSGQWTPGNGQKTQRAPALVETGPWRNSNLEAIRENGGFSDRPLTKLRLKFQWALTTARRFRRSRHRCLALEHLDKNMVHPRVWTASTGSRANSVQLVGSFLYQQDH